MPGSHPSKTCHFINLTLTSTSVNPQRPCQPDDLYERYTKQTQVKSTEQVPRIKTQPACKPAASSLSLCFSVSDRKNTRTQQTGRSSRPQPDRSNRQVKATQLLLLLQRKNLDHHQTLINQFLSQRRLVLRLSAMCVCFLRHPDRQTGRGLKN